MKLTRSIAGIIAAAVIASAPGTALATGNAPKTPPASGPVAAAPAPVSAIEQVFDLRGLAAGQRDLVLQTLKAHDFDWLTLLPALRAQGARSRIPIHVADTSAWGAVGLAWPAPVGKVEIDDDVKSPYWFRDIVAHEVGHIVDFYLLEPKGLRDDIAAIYGRPWSEISHSFNNAFTNAFSPYGVKDQTYPLSPEQVQQVRDLLGGTGAPPPAAARKAPPRARAIDDPDFHAATHPPVGSSPAREGARR